MLASYLSIFLEQKRQRISALEALLEQIKQEKFVREREGGGGGGGEEEEGEEGEEGEGEGADIEDEKRASVAQNLEFGRKKGFFEARNQEMGGDLVENTANYSSFSSKIKPETSQNTHLKELKSDQNDGFSD